MTSASGGPKGAAPPDARSSPPEARPSSSARRPWPAAGRSRRPVRQPGGSSATPRPRPGTDRASRSARPRSHPTRARPAPDPRPAGAAAPFPACVAPTSAAVARAWARLRQRGGRAPPGPRPPPQPRPSSPPCNAYLQSGVSKNRRPGDSVLDHLQPEVVLTYAENPLGVNRTSSGQVEANLSAEPAFGADAAEVTDQEHAAHQLRIDRRAPD